MEQSWVSQLESVNHDHTFESVLVYLNAVGAKLNLSFVLHGEIIVVNPQDVIAVDILQKH